MRISISTLIFVLAVSLLALPIGSAPVRGCEDIESEVAALVGGGQFAAAEEVARAKVAESPNSLKAHVSLAHVFVRWGLRAETVVDTEALGFAPGETGTRVSRGA